MTKARFAALAAVPLALGACSFIDNFPDVAPDPDPTTSTAGSGGVPTMTDGSTTNGAGMGGSSTSSTSSTSSASSGSGGACEPAFELCATPIDENCDSRGCVGAYVAAERFGDLGDERAKAVAAAGSDAILLGAATGAVDFGVGAMGELGSPAVSDLILARYTPTLSALWQKRVADTAPGGVAVSLAGDVFLAGGALGDVDFGGGVLVGAGAAAHDAVVARFDASGKHVWSQRWGDAGDQIANAIAVGSQGDSVFTGGFAGNLAIGPGAPLAAVGASDLFVARLDPVGKPLWSKSFGSVGYAAQARAVAVDSAGNTVIAGYFTGALDLGGGLLVSQGDTDIFVAKIDPAGAPLWSQAFGGPAADRAYGVAIGPADTVFVTGGYRGVVTFGALPAVATPSLADVSSFVVKLDASGTTQWVRAQTDPMGMPSGVDQRGLGVAVDAEGNAVITGYASGITVFDAANPIASARVAAGNTDAFVAKYSPSGALVWAELHGDAAQQVGLSVAAGPLGAVWATGVFAGSIDFGPAPPAVLTSAGATDAFLAHLSP